MAWAVRTVSKGQIDRAGRALVELPQDDPNREAAIAVVDSWRSCHAYPLQIIKMTLLQRARKIDPNALIAQRLKRRRSIEAQLRDNSNMKLSQMQDIGDVEQYCPTIFRSDSWLMRTKNFTQRVQRTGRTGTDRTILTTFYDQSRTVIEACILFFVFIVQVQTAQVFTGQALKSKVKSANQDWLRFFALTSSAFAWREKTPWVPGTSMDPNEVVRELREIIGRTNIMSSLSGWNDIVHFLEFKDTPGASFYLLTLDSVKGTLTVVPFKGEEADQSQRAYDKAEKDTEGNPNTQVVLVSVDHVDALRKAYPNYYVDTKGFISAVEKAISSK
jgi:hypothetical protein